MEDVIFNWAMPEKTKTYQPISNESIHTLCKEQADANGLVITDSTVNYKMGKNCVVKYRLEPKDFPTPDKEVSLMAAWKNGYDKQVSFGFAIGSVVNICTNGMVRGEFALKRKHTGKIESVVESAVKEYFSRVKEEHLENLKFKRLLKEQEVSQKDLNEFLGALMRDPRKIMTQAQLRQFVKECEESKNFHTIGDGNFSAWDMYNAGTECLKTTASNIVFKKHIEFNDFTKEVLAL